MWHDTGSGASELPSGGWLEPGEHAESPATKRRLKNLLDATGLTDEPRAARTACRRRSRSSAAFMRRSTSSASASSRPAAAAMPAARRRSATAPSRSRSSQPAARSRPSMRCSTGRSTNAYALVRPPGHHALPDRGMGFCLFANVAVGVRHAQAARGLGRVAVVDWDVHHGNGTQAIFWDDPSVLAISLHQDGLYPARSGLLSETGAGAGTGTTLNVPLPAGSGTGAYLDAIDRVVVPALEAFAPELVVIACGFDAGALDPLGRMLLPAAAFGAMTERLLDVTGAPLRRSPRRLARGWLLGRARPVLRALGDRGALGPVGRYRRPVRLPRRHPGPGALAAPARRGRRCRCARCRGAALSDLKLVLVLSENWTLTPPRDLRGLVEMAVVAEDAGFDAVMVSEHIVLGPSAGAEGIMGNPRDYAMPGNQDPAMPWPSSLVLLSAIAAATTRMRLAACAVIAPLRHPLLLARELGTLDLLSEGRLVVQPTVSWHRDEYEALGVPFSQARRPPRRAPRGVGGPLARHARLVRRRALRLRGRVLRAQGLASRRAAAVARRRVGAPTPPAPDRPLRPRLPSARPALRRRPGPAAGRPCGGGPRPRGARARRRHARRLP